MALGTDGCERAHQRGGGAKPRGQDAPAIPRALDLSAHIVERRPPHGGPAARVARSLRQSSKVRLRNMCVVPLGAVRRSE